MTKKTYAEIMHQLASDFPRGPKTITEEMIQRYETEIGFSLPGDYRDFLREFGFSGVGSVTYPDPKQPHLPGGGVEVFFGLDPQDSYDLRAKRSTVDDRLPPNVIPIASSPGGLICLSLAGSDRGTVYWWDRAEDFDEPYKNLSFVAPNFDSFIRSLQLKDPSDS